VGAARMSELEYTGVTIAPASRLPDVNVDFNGEGAWESNPPAPGAPTPTQF
jgi:hypothetical protein